MWLQQLTFQLTENMVWYRKFYTSVRVNTTFWQHILYWHEDCVKFR